MDNIDYEKQGNDFLTATNTELKIEYIGKRKHFPDDREERDCYNVTLSRDNRSYSFVFGDSIANTEKREVAKRPFQPYDYSRTMREWKKAKAEYKEPRAYDILSCLTKYDPGTFSDFCSEYGYDNDSIRAKNTYEAVRDEYLNLAKLYNNAEMEKMAEIA
jgi:hypothetical protein